MATDQRTRYRSVRFGVDTIEAGLVLPRHRHAAGYATVVLAGCFEEASFAGRFIARPGDVLLHGAFDCHANRAMTRLPLQIVRLPWDDNLLEGRFRARDPDALARLAERDPAEALERPASPVKCIQANKGFGEDACWSILAAARSRDRLSIERG